MAGIQPLLGKRKRAQISYAEDNDELDSLLFGDDDVNIADEKSCDDDQEGREEEPVTDDDAEYGKKASKKAIASRRDAKRMKRAAASEQEPHAKPFPFLGLPLELRYMIYGYALTDISVGLCTKTKSYRRTVIRYDPWPRNNTRVDSVTGKMIVDNVKWNLFAPGLLAVNKQIHDESAVFLYGQPFVCQDLYTLHSFVAAIGQRNCNRLLDITVKYWGHGRGVHHAMNFCAFALLAQCTNLKSVLIDYLIHWQKPPRLLAREVYRNAHPFLEAYGAAKGRKDAALDILMLSSANFERYRDGRKVESEKVKQEYYAELRKLLGVK